MMNIRFRPKLLPALALATTISVAIATPAQAQDGARMIEQMQKADANRDGAISRKELLVYRASQFDRIDRNGDGVLTSNDMPSFAKVRERMEAATAGFDRNGDGKITRAEFASGPTAAFDRADSNHDGIVTRQELEAARAVMKQEFAK